MIIKELKKEYLFENDIRLFDIETTGLSAQTSYVYLIGYMEMRGNECILTQLFAEDFNEEKELLSRFISVCKEDPRTLISYNGSSFDIPYLNKKFKRHALGFYIDPDKSVDHYKTLMHYKKYIPLESLKLTEAEKAAGFNRNDTFTGEELIDLYATLTGKIRLASITKKAGDIENVNALEHVILLHNNDDIEGLYCIHKKLNIKQALAGAVPFETNTTPFEISFTFDRPLLPSVTEINTGNIYIENGSEKCDLIVPLRNGTLKYFFADYKNYSYIIDKDECMHNSAVYGIDPSNKRKCTKENAFLKKTTTFVHIPKTFCDIATEKNIKLFKEDYSSKEFYAEAETIRKYEKEYVSSLLEEL